MTVPGAWAVWVKALLTSLAALMLNGCAAVAVGTIVIGAAALHDRREPGTVIEDQAIELRLYERLRELKGSGDRHIRVTSHNRIVLLVGEVSTEDARAQAQQIAIDTPKVRQVVNELAVQAPTNLGRRSRDTILTGQVKTALIGLDIEHFDPTRVNITSVRGQVYLMGLVHRHEAEAVVAKVRRVRGVKRVIKVFEYLD